MREFDAGLRVAVPPPSATTLLEQLKLSLGSDEVFIWRQRLLQERLIKNVTEKMERVLVYVREMLDSGLDQFSHAEIAASFQDIKIGTVKDALRRAKALGLLDWQEQYRAGPNGTRRRTVNLYRLSMPAQSPQPRRDLRRHHKSKPAGRPHFVQKPAFLSSLLTCSPQSGERPTGFEARFAAKLLAEKQRRAARAARTLPTDHRRR